jgi:hypothetical protein
MADQFFPDKRADYQHHRSTSGGDSNVFVRYLPGPVQFLPSDYPTVVFENLKIKQVESDAFRGQSSFQLFLTLSATAKGNGRYELAVLRAEVDAFIEINRKEKFDRLADFKPIYDDFVASGGLLSPKAAAAAAAKHTLTGGHHATKFDGIRAKTMRHELDHVAYAVKQADGLVYNLINEARSRGKQPAEGYTPEDRIGSILTMLLGDRGFYLDVGGREHDEIVLRDFYFMVGMYEQFHLQLPEKSNIAYDAVVAARTNYRLLQAMRELNEPPPWS